MLQALFFVFATSTPAFAGDKDKDGVPNKIDACKAEAEDIDGFEDEDGCPDLDNDKDGLADTKDKCPNEPEDKDGFEDEDGCPDPDNDGDGVNDDQDQCAHEMEDGVGKKDGCPEATFELITASGWMPALEALGAGLGEFSAKKAEGCSDAATVIEDWMSKNDASVLSRVFEARVGRNETFTLESMSKFVALKFKIYQGHRDAMDIFCAEHPSYSAQTKKLDAVLLPVAPKQ